MAVIAPANLPSDIIAEIKFAGFMAAWRGVAEIFALVIYLGLSRGKVNSVILTE